MDSRNEEESMSHRSMRRPSAEKCEHHSLQFKGAEKNREKQSIWSCVFFLFALAFLLFLWMPLSSHYLQKITPFVNKFERAFIHWLILPSRRYRIRLKNVQNHVANYSHHSTWSYYLLIKWALFVWEREMWVWERRIGWSRIENGARINLEASGIILSLS